MQQPAFWDNKKSFIAVLLYPVGLIYSLVVAFRLLFHKPYRSQAQVVCIGNICIGGSGKTPLALFLGDYLQKMGKNVFFLGHGYKSRLQNILVDLSVHTYKDVSDEALLLAHQLPTVVNRNRAEGAKLAEQLGAQIIVMDDGFQNPSLKKDVSLLVFDGKKGMGNAFCLPAGPLRERLHQGLKRASAVVIIGKDETNLAAVIKNMDMNKPILTGSIEQQENLKGKSGIAFAGIGHPQKFFEMLRKNGVSLEKTFVFPDHYSYQRKDIEKLIALHQNIFTTAKDAVKIDADLKKYLTVVNIRFVPSSYEDWNCFFRKILK